jgi:hypothetical protein
LAASRYSRATRTAASQLPFTFKWDVTTPAAPEGAYKLVLSGYLLDTNQKISQVVQFYHRPLIR